MPLILLILKGPVFRLKFTFLFTNEIGFAIMRKIECVIGVVYVSVNVYICVFFVLQMFNDYLSIYLIIRTQVINDDQLKTIRYLLHFHVAIFVYHF